jgi:hypothetical protein
MTKREIANLIAGRDVEKSLATGEAAAICNGVKCNECINNCNKTAGMNEREAATWVHDQAIAWLKDNPEDK